LTAGLDTQKENIRGTFLERSQLAEGAYVQSPDYE